MVYVPGDPTPRQNPRPDAPTALIGATHPVRRNRSRAGLLVVIAVGVGLISACGRGSTVKPAANPSPTCDVIGINGCTAKAGNGGGPVQYSPPAAQAIPASVKQACDLNEQMRNKATDGDLRSPGATIGQIQALAGNASNFDVKFAANMLKDRYDLAVAARGGADEVSTTLDLLGASIQMSTACERSSWSKP